MVENHGSAFWGPRPLPPCSEEKASRIVMLRRSRIRRQSNTCARLVSFFHAAALLSLHGLGIPDFRVSCDATEWEENVSGSEWMSDSRYNVCMTSSLTCELPDLTSSASREGDGRVGPSTRCVGTDVDRVDVAALKLAAEVLRWGARFVGSSSFPSACS